MELQDKKAFIINFIYWGIIVGIIFVLLKFALPLCMPFVIGFCIAALLRPMVEKITERFHAKRKWVAVTFLLLFYGTLGTLIALAGIKIFISMQDLFINLPAIYTTDIEPALLTMLSNIESFFKNLDPSFMANMAPLGENLLSSMTSIVSSVSSSAIKLITAAAASIPATLIAFLFTIIASVFISIDYHAIMAFISRQMPYRLNVILAAAGNNLFSTIFKFIRAYAILMTLTFIELSIGLTILKVDNAIAVALLIACIDILPVLGTGGVVIPWFLISFINGNISFGIGLAILYVVITLVRNVLEPKVVGDQIGLYPLVTLFCMYVGAQLFGVFGLFGLPIAVTILKNLNDNKTIQLFK